MSLRRVFVMMLVLAVALSSGLALAAEQPREGGNLAIALIADAGALDPLLASCVRASTVLSHIIESLFVLTPEGDILPGLAVGYELSPDGLVWTLFLREGVSFHDGTAFNAEAVKINLDRFIERARFKFLLTKVVNVEVVDDHTINLHTEVPFAPLRSHLTHSFVGMVSPASIAVAGEDPIDPVGTGPFEFIEWIRGERIVVRKNPNYWGEGPYLDEVVFRIIPEDGARVIALQTGEVDVIFDVPVLDVAILDADPNTKVVHTPGLGVTYLGFNVQRPPFTDVRVRQALNYAVNKEEIVTYILGGAARVADSPIAPPVFGYRRIGPFAHNPERARELLAEAGFPDGFTTSVVTRPGGARIEIVEAIQAQLREVGVEMEIVVMEWATLLEFTRRPVEESEVEIYYIGWTTVTGDADYGLFPLFHTSQWVPVGPNRSFYSNPRVDHLLEEARTTFDLALRKEIYAEALEIIWYDAPFLFLYNRVLVHGQRGDIRGIVYHPDASILAMRAWRD